MNRDKTGRKSKLRHKHNADSDFPRIQSVDGGRRIQLKEIRGHDKVKIKKDPNHQYRLFLEPREGEPNQENERRVDERGRLVLPEPIEANDTVAVIKETTRGELEVAKVVEISDGDKKWRV